MSFLLDFCKQFPSIICYGVSDHGFMVKHFLEAHGIYVSGFLVSDKREEDSLLDGVPVYAVQDVDSLPLDCGIVLSLFERHHATVLQNLKVNGSLHEVYPISDAAQQKMHKELLQITRKRVLAQTVDFSKTEKEQFETLFQQLSKQYRIIECRFMEAIRVGALSLWRYYCYLRYRDKNNVFYLYYPVTQEHHPEEHLRGANGYLLSKMQCRGIETLNESNLKFWQYVFQKHSDWFIMNDSYTFTEWTQNMLNDYKHIPTDENLLTFDDVERKDGNKRIKNLGIITDYVCISNRDMMFLQTAKRERLIPDFRDSYRNSDIENHGVAVDYLATCNIQAVRMGAVVEKQWRHENVINYAGSKYRSEFMDLYLVSQCKFFVGDLSGILAFAMLLAKPMIITNAPLLTNRYDAAVFCSPDRDIALLKKLWDTKNKRYLTIRDMLNFEINICTQEPNLTGAAFAEYRRREILPVDNTPEDILAVVKEMNERIDGTIQYDALDLELQQRYREIVDNYPMKDNILNNWRLGAAFLRENQWLLE
ncbi:MAG: TIGR04372 family glycosyltransferase [Schwartzia sp.]|nr:TIGR04372 family glycosyltransferase [Schwartzia sp. (in: firmicutes)]